MKPLCIKQIARLAFLVTLVTAFGIPAAADRRVTVVTSDAVALEWNEIAYTAVAAQPPFPQARFMAIVQVAVFEAVNAITGKYEPYLGTISAPPGASTKAAAAQATRDVLVAYGLGATMVPSLDERLAATLANIPDGQAKTDGIAVGIAAAAAMVTNRVNDGSAPAAFYMPTTSNPYEWQTYAGCPTGGGAFFHWRNVTPFAIESSSQFRAEPPPDLGTGVYGMDFNEVQRVGAANASAADRPPDRADVARLYSVTGLGLFNGILAQIARTRKDDISDTVRTLALMNIAIMDASISVFDSKYYYKTWRPVTAIPRGDEDGNKRTTPSEFTQYIRATPCFPGYPSAHGSLSNSAAMVLQRTYGRFGHSLTVSHPDPYAAGIVLHYTDLKDITDDISDARVYGGIHFRFDQDAGERQGHAVGQYVYNNKLQKLF